MYTYKTCRQDVVLHVCNLSYLGGGFWEESGASLPEQKLGKSHVDQPARCGYM
jgi:hypothetical protein